MDEILTVARFVEYGFRNQVQVIVVIGTDTQILDGGVGSLQDELVKLFFARRELAAYRKRPRYVCRVMLPGRPGVYQHEPRVVDRLVVAAVVQHGRVRPVCQDRAEAEKLRAFHLVNVLEDRLQLELHHSRLD